MNKECPVCGNDEYVEAYRGSEFNLLKCNCCGLVLKSFDKELRREDVQHLQDVVYSDLNRRDLSKIRSIASDRLKLLMQFRKEGDLLEIGCATGEFIEEALRCGFKATGLDASDMYAEYTKQKGLDIVHGRLEDPVFLKRSFDVVTMFHVFEHIESPNEFLASLRDYVTDGGLLMVIVPNLASTTDRMYRFQHPTFHQADHLYFYDASTLSTIFSKHGFDVLSIESKEYPHHLFTSFIGFLVNKATGKPTEGDEAVMSASGPDNGRQNKNTNSRGMTSKLKNILRETPYLIGILLYPILWLYGSMVDRRIKGHELIVVAKKR